MKIKTNMQFSTFFKGFFKIFLKVFFKLFLKFFLNFLTPYSFLLSSVDVRLNGGNSKANGRVEFFFNGLWGTVCATNWDLRDAQVVCRMLGYRHVLRATSVKRHGGNKTPIWLDRLHCRGLEQNIESCQYTGWGVSKCNSNMEAWITCDTLQGLCLNTDCY